MHRCRGYKITEGCCRLVRGRRAAPRGGGGGSRGEVERSSARLRRGPARRRMTTLDVLSLIDQVLGRAARRWPLRSRARGPQGGTGADTADRSRRRDRRDGGDRDTGARERGNRVQRVEDHEDGWASIGVLRAQRGLASRREGPRLLRRPDAAPAEKKLFLAPAADP